MYLLVIDYSELLECFYVQQQSYSMCSGVQYSTAKAMLGEFSV